MNKILLYGFLTFVLVSFVINLSHCGDKKEVNSDSLSQKKIK